MNYSEARVVQGFKELLETLRGMEAPTGAKDRIKANTLARERAMARVRTEYEHMGLKPPHPLALSLTARRELGIPLPQSEANTEEERA